MVILKFIIMLLENTAEQRKGNRIAILIGVALLAIVIFLLLI